MANSSSDSGFVGQESQDPTTEIVRPTPVTCLARDAHAAAVKLQKAYKGYRTRRNLADVLGVLSLWKQEDFEEFQHSSITMSRTRPAKANFYQVGKGISKNERSQKLALQHWLEAIDPRHRYGRNLHFYYELWLNSQTNEPFFYWLDVGEGKEFNLEKCPRLKFRYQCIKYLGPVERKAYEVAPDDGKLFYKQTGELLDTTIEPNVAQWIFVLSPSLTLYVGKKKNGNFHHSSFLSGGAILAAGKIIVEDGILKAVWQHGGHYRPTLENFQWHIWILPLFMFHDYSFNKQLITRLGRLFLIVGDYITKLSSQHGHVIDLLWCLYYWAGLPSDIKDTRFLHQKLMKELRVFFRVPNQEIISGIKPTPSPNQVVPTFINFLLQISEEILRTEPDFIVSIKDSVEILRTELEFLITFLGDKPILKEIDNIFTDIETFVNELGSFLCSTIFIFTYVGDKPISRLTDDEEAKNALMDIKALRLLDFFIFDGNDQAPVTGISDRALSSLLLKMDLVNAKIKEQIIRVSKMPSDVAPRTSVVSPFIVDSVLDDLVHLLTNRADKIIGVNDQIVMLHEELMLLQSSVTDITMQQQTEHKELLIRSTDVAYEVEYIINSFPPFWYLILRLPQLIEKIKLIRMAIKVMKENIVAAGMLEVAKYPGEQVTSQSEEHPILEDVAGLENETIKIVKQLVGGPVRLQVISIFGMPGLGKTTLAKKLYNDPSVVYHFYKRAWCVVSQTYNKRIMLIDILRSISQLKRETIKNKEDELLAEDIYKSLKGMRYLIVMDDIWDINVWNDLKIYFPNDNVGSRILFTTRNKDVGMKVSPHSVINALPFMSKDECWKLLQQKVFGNEQCPPGLLDIGKQIATSCHGLPLAVVVISAVLANMGKKLRLWLEVERNLSSYILENPNDYILILELSYNHLPMHLKPCFLYFGAFKEDIKIPVRKLISLWVAEGFIKKEEQKSPEDVAYEYLMELIDRSLVLVSERRSDGGVKSCEIHDLLRVMCVRIAEEENFLKVVEGRISIYGKHHRLSIDDRAPYACSLHFGLHVRSLLYTSSETPTLTSCGFKVLRVLDSSYRSSDFIDVTEIEQLVHLRYLAVPCTRLPSVESLHRLEFLFVENSEVVEIPEFLLNMINLRHAYFMGGACFGASFRCHATEDESFPINFLQRVSFLSISDKKDEKILRRSPNLHRLKCRVQSSFSPSFYYHNKLDSLSVYYNDSEDSCCGSIILPLNLRKLSLGKICASPKQMEIIGRLLNLEVLKLLDATFEGEQWDTREGEFPRLKFLKLDGVRIAEWNTSSDHFPRLQRIVLQDCHHLKMIHSTIGDIPTLQMIEVYRCAYAIIESAMQIQEEQRDMGNEELKVKISY